MQPEKHSFYAECGAGAIHQSFNAIKLNYIKLSFSFGCRLMRARLLLSHAAAATAIDVHELEHYRENSAERCSVSLRACAYVIQKKSYSFRFSGICMRA